MYMFIYMYVRIGMYSLRRCYTQLFRAHAKYAHKKEDLEKQICKLVSFSSKATAGLWLMLGSANLMADCSLEVSLHPEGPATGQLCQGFPWFPRS
jgi:hypothetical protein